jgi:hypothetical protein
MFKPSLIAMDYETALTDGTPSVEYYREDFRVISAAFAWFTADGSVKTKFLEGEGPILTMLESIKQNGIKAVVHNFQFEYGVTKHRFPGLESVVQLDTMRLTQVADNGGKQAQRDFEREIEGGEEFRATSGLRLSDCVGRWLQPEFRNHKEPAYRWLRENAGVKAGDEGKNLHKLPPEVLRDYNVADAVVTLHLADTLLRKFEREGYDYTLDHYLYTASAKRIAEAKGRGVKVDRDALQKYRVEVVKQIEHIEREFRQAFAGPIAEIEAETAEAYINAVKTPRGQEQRRVKVAAGEAGIGFNVGSNKQLARLFVDKLKLTPKFYTEESKQSKAKRRDKPDLSPFTPQPSFKAAHLATYGAGGEILIERRKRMLVLTQIDSLLELSEADGRWHVDLKAAGTVTGRFAGGRVG